MAEDIVLYFSSLFEIPGKIDFFGTEVAPFTIILAILVVVAGFSIGHFARVIATKYIGSRLTQDTRKTMGRLIYYAIIAVGLVSALGISGLDLSGVFLAGGIAGIVIGLATQSLFSNLISGIFLQIDKPMRIGDPVLITGKLPEVGGVVVEIATLSSRLRMFDGTYVRLPNSDVFLSEIRNYSNASVKRIELDFSVGYREDTNKVVALVRHTLAGIPLILVEPEPDVYVEKLTESSVVINVWCWTPFSVWFDLRKHVIRQIKLVLQKNGIELQLPQQVLHVIPGGQKAVSYGTNQIGEQKVQKLGGEQHTDSLSE